ncbi:MAG: carbon storage regulator CsrA [Negativicutes bacterium]|nr:carbon storage regulator CsrA [Negativicutes bacterium]MDR3589768.1 carbon storage regulator CsrA [Negativicutes bacterium]
MLILARKKNQSLRIGDNIIITVADVQGDQVRLGISAPKDVQILRQELYDAVKDSNKNAAEAVQQANLDSFLTQMKQLKDEEKE